MSAEDMARLITAEAELCAELCQYTRGLLSDAYKYYELFDLDHLRVEAIAVENAIAH